MFRIRSVEFWISSWGKLTGLEFCVPHRELVKQFFMTCRGPSVESRKPQQIVIYRSVTSSSVLSSPSEGIFAQSSSVVILARVCRWKRIADELVASVSRDGVSESQFQQVLETELMAFKRALRGLERPDSTYNPKVTLIVVQKRHHTRFFPTSGGGNVKPGNARMWLSVFRRGRSSDFVGHCEICRSSLNWFLPAFVLMQGRLWTPMFAILAITISSYAVTSA